MKITENQARIIGISPLIFVMILVIILISIILISNLLIGKNINLDTYDCQQIEDAIYDKEPIYSFEGWSGTESSPFSKETLIFYYENNCKSIEVQER